MSKTTSIATIGSQIYNMYANDDGSYRLEPVIDSGLVGKKVYYIRSTGEVVGPNKYAGISSSDNYARECFGNLFRTKYQARAAEEAVKALLELIGQPVTPAEATYINNLQIKIDEARSLQHYPEGDN